MAFGRGDLVWRLAEDGRTPARIVIGPHTAGDVEVVILCDPAHWPEGPPVADDYWGEWMYAWPTEALDCTEDADTSAPHSP